MKRLRQALKKSPTIEADLENEAVPRTRSFEYFVKMIKNSDSLWELLQVRDTIIAQIERRIAEIGKSCSCIGIIIDI